MDISEILRVYLGSNSTGGVLPYGMRERLRERYEEQAAAFEAEVDRVLDGLLDVPDTVRNDSPEAIGNFAAEQARARRPKLSDDVCQAIGNYVAYQWR